MPGPVKPDLDYSYTGYQQGQQGVSNFPGTFMDDDLAELKRGIDDAIDALADVRRSDGALPNEKVTVDSLSSSVKLLLGVNDGSAVPIYASVSGLSGLKIHSGTAAIQLSAYAVPGDGGGWPLAVEVTNTGTLQPWQRQSNSGTRRWQLVTEGPRPQMFGAIGGVDDTAAVQAALNYGASSVVFPSANYAVTQIIPPSNCRISALGRNAKITAVGTSHAVYLNGVSHVTIEGLLFQGHNTPGVNGVYADNASDIKVVGCLLDQFGTGDLVGDATTAAIWMHAGCTDVHIQGNKVTGGTGKNNGNDIMVYSTSGNAIITGNMCYSPNSNGIFTNGVNPTGRVVISGNISMNHKRHGIVPVYGGTAGYRADVVVSGNICIDCDSTGIYANSDLSGFAITGNIVYSCSGGGGNGYVLDGGISIIGAGHKVVSGNYIANSGKTSAGVTRTIDTDGVTNDPTMVTGIRMNATDHCVVTGNIISGSTGRGINVYAGSAYSQVLGNTIRNCAYSGIYLEAMNTAGQFITVKNNVVDQSVSDGMGVWHRGGIADDTCILTGNMVIGKKAGTAKDGIRLEGNGFVGRIQDNDVKNWDTGLNLQNTAALSARLGSTLIMDGNAFTSNTVGFNYLSAAAGFGFYTNNTFSGNGTDVSDQSAQGVVLAALSVSPVKVAYKSAAPVAGTWVVGDRIINTVPAVSSPKAWVCTVAGSPGTWVSEGNL